MEVLVEAPRRTASRLSKAIHARLRFALRRLGWLVPRAVVRLSEVERDAGDAGKRCEVRLNVVGTGDVVVAATSRDWLQSIDDALRSAARRLERKYRRVYAG
ncbi:MAG: HPF/RaiA family ribosome-associated protein [Aromatoleum sp.]|jgi:ribosome-associated translation inhibitor RaiA|uniref:HPF/RaiA family ribosome-associated protein n=1 Tax=Aromatoleum sp. TaxID=2307007 RepID=UPI0028942325|nr:HPF/RaiA family ribosome-associated protein [Aromatoleum sp.]MDT3670115.1 HPF/RaiA family ribosome-associated protein [Aromatoleum sp.]